MKYRTRFAVGALVWAALLLIPAFTKSGAALTSTSAQAGLLARTAPPASMATIEIRSSDARMNGLIYLTSGADAHPVVVFLHGYPGIEKNLDLAQAVRRAGYQALYIDYRGMWGSGGTFSFTHGLEDAQAILSWVRAPENAAKYRLDARRIALVGHSFGGWLALMMAGREPPAVCVAALAAWNVGWAAQRFAAHADERASNLDDFRTTTDSNGGPVRANPNDLLNELVAHANAWDYLSQAPALGDRALLTCRRHARYS